MIEFRRRSRSERTGAGDDAGFTLVELLVAMGLFLVLLTVFGAAVAAMTDDVRKTQGISEATDNVRLAFDRFDKQVRYSYAINPATRVGNDWYVEFDTVDVNGNRICRQWRLSAADQDLQQRSWPAGTAPASAPAWSTVAAGVINDPSTEPPFTVAGTTVARPYQRLTLDLVVQRSAGPGGRAATSTAFYGRNTGPDTVTPVCTQVGRS